MPPRRACPNRCMRARPSCAIEMGLSLVDGIAALGALDYLAIGLDGLGKPTIILERQVGRWKAQLESYAEFKADWNGRADIPGVDARRQMARGAPPATFQPGLIHGDYHLGNVMYRFDAPELAAIVDWELTTIGDPLLDLGWLLATWPDVRRQPRRRHSRCPAVGGLPDRRRTRRALPARPRAISAPSTGTACSPVTSSASYSKAPMRAPAPARRQRRPGDNCCTRRTDLACSSARCDGSADTQDTDTQGKRP
jgi:aminoglycoside phosphotransferase (APT) family kinase protein